MQAVKFMFLILLITTTLSIYNKNTFLNKKSLLAEGNIINGFITERQQISYAGNFYITNAFFYQCVGSTVRGGGILIDLSSGSLSITDTVFYMCSSAIEGGAIYYTGHSLKIGSCCFNNCSSASHDALYVNCEGTLSLTNEVGIFSCAIDGRTSSGPNTAFIAYSSNIRGLNMSKNYATGRQETGTVSIVSTSNEPGSPSASVSYSQFFMNYGYYVLYSSNRVLSISYCNFINNRFTKVIFCVAKYRMNCNYLSITGDPTTYEDNFIDAFAIIQDPTGSINIYGSQVSYPLFNISLIHGNIMQFSRDDISTISIPFILDNHCINNMNSYANFTNSIFFPSEIQNIIGIALVGIFIISSVVLYLVMEYRRNRDMRVIPNDEVY